MNIDDLFSVVDERMDGVMDFVSLGETRMMGLMPASCCCCCCCI